MLRCLFISLLFPLLFSAAPLQLFDASEPDLQVKAPAVRPVEHKVIEQDGRKLVWFHQRPEAGRFIEFELPPSRKLPDCRRVRLSVDIYLPEKHGGARLNLRFRDGQGEIFHISAALKDCKPGWNTLTYELDTTRKITDSWGRNLNKNVDYPLSFIGFAFSSGNDNVKRTWGLANVSAEIFDTRIVCGLDTGNPIHVLQPKDDDKLALMFTNPGTAEQTFKMSYTYLDAWGNVLEQRPVEKTVPANSTTRLPIKAPSSFGTFYLDIHSDDVLGKLFKRLSFCRIIPAGPTPGRSRNFIFGVHYHVLRYKPEDQEKDLLAAAMCGVKVFRHSGIWTYLQPGTDKPLDFTGYDAMLDRCDKYGLEVQPILGRAPDWATDKDWKPFNANFENRFGNRGTPAPDLEAWKNYVTAYMTRYRGRIRFVESWNEPDLFSFANFSLEKYVEIQKACYESVKAVAPETFVLTGGYAGLKMAPERTAHPDYLRKSLAETRGYFDVNAFHAHGIHVSFINQITGLRAIHHELNMNVAWWANETALHSVGNMGELNQACCLFRKFLYSWANGAMGYNWYDLRNDGFDKSEPEHNYGMITRDFHPKAVYSTYNTLATFFRDASFLREFSIDDKFQAYLFQAGNGDFLIPCWNIRDKRPSHKLIIHKVTGALERLDIFGNATPIAVENGTANVESTSTPVFFRVSGQLRQPVVENNPAQEEKHRQQIGSQPSSKPDFVLNDFTQMWSFVGNEPNTSHLVWKGPDDCSAKIWLGCDQENFVLNIDVKDDIHNQPFKGEEVWKGDNIQFALLVNGQSRAWEFGLTREQSGDAVHLWSVPQEFDGDTVRKQLTLKTERDEATHLTCYRATLPCKAIGLTVENLQRGFPFNLIVNDNDGPQRESFLFIAPGLGTDKHIDDFPILMIGK